MYQDLKMKQGTVLMELHVSVSHYHYLNPLNFVIASSRTKHCDCHWNIFIVTHLPDSFYPVLLILLSKRCYKISIKKDERYLRDCERLVSIVTLMCYPSYFLSPGQLTKRNYVALTLCRMVLSGRRCSKIFLGEIS